ncbi:hypothetical protein [Halostagnicola kamekurae]|nr:hypothetical protein [Halostagnicola kamekurae]
MNRPENEKILNKHTIAYAIDHWDEEEELWKECEFHLGTSEDREWFD